MLPDDFEAGAHRTGRWRGVGAATLLAGGLGLVTRRPALLLVSALGVALLAYARLVPAPPLSLAVRRTTSSQSVDPGEEIRVRLVVENAGDRTIPDLRLVDGVPRLLEVVDGTPAIGTTLRPGETATVSYAVEARRGTHQFGPAVAVARDVAGVVERRERVAVTDAGQVDASPSATLRTTLPLRTSTARFAGREPTDESGEGIAFDTVREYRRGDPPSRINWRTLARTGDLTTVEHRTDGGVAAVVAVDARPPAARAPAPEQPTAVERSAAAATALVERLAEDGHRVGVATLDGERRWLPPDTGPEHVHRAREVLSERPGAAAYGSDRAAECEASEQLDWLSERVRGETEVLLLSPVPDDAIVDLATRLEASGTPVTVLSPDNTDDATPGRRLARLERRRRLRELRTSGVAVVDWQRDEPLERATSRLRVEP